MLLTPALVGLVVVYFGFLTRRYSPVGTIEPAATESLVESLRVVPRLLTRYPMVALLAGAMFLNVLLQCLSEYLAFSIYTIHYPRIEELAIFLGTVNAGLNILGFVIVIVFTEPALKKFGVAAMNRIYPALNVVSFGIMTASTSLAAGILANVAYDPFVHSIDVPVTTMNYNAIRHRLVGRVRVFVDGVVYPLALALAGGLLALFQHGLGLRQIAGIGLAISILLLVLHWQIGKQYIQGLLGMLRDGALDFEQRSVRCGPRRRRSRRSAQCSPAISARHMRVCRWRCAATTSLQPRKSRRHWPRSRAPRHGRSWNNSPALLRRHGCRCSRASPTATCRWCAGSGSR